MGLAERRAAKEFQDNRLPALRAEINAAAGFDVPLDIDWEKLSSPDQAHLYDESWAKVYFRPLIDGLRAITIDDMGREALKHALKRVIITNTSGVYYGDRWAAFGDGVLRLDHEPCTNVDDIDDRRKGVVTVLEKAL